MLRTEPSLSVYNEGTEDEDRNLLMKKESESELELERTITIGDSIDGYSDGFSFGKKLNVKLINEDDEEGTRENHEAETPPSPPMYLATGLGIEIGVDLNPLVPEFDDLEGYYKRMVEEYPYHPLFLRNYAQLLQSKGDLHGAEDYYYRSTLANPEDGETLSNFAKLVWELHRDQSRALHYFELAARAAPQDSNVLAAYASFLWEIDGDDDDDDEEEEERLINQFQDEEEIPNKVDGSDLIKQESEADSSSLNLAPGVGDDLINFSGTDASKDIIDEEYYKRMLVEDPHNALVLKNYARFLCQTKGELQRAEEYYSSSVQADPTDGEAISEYARLVWDLHHDHDKALSYFEKAVQAIPDNSYVLAAYARFLWETEEDEQDPA